MATIFIFNLITTIDKNLYVIYNVFYNKGVFIMSNENQKDNNKVSIMPFIVLFLISIVIFAFLYFLHSKNIENRFNSTLQNYEKSMSIIFDSAIITNGSNENIYSAKEDLKLSFEVGFKMLESSMNEIMKNANDILQFWFAFLSVIMIVFTLIGFFLNNNILNQAREQLEIIKDKSEILIQGLENKYNSAIKDINKRGEEESKKLTEESDLFNLGIQAYNNKDYKTSEYYFTKVIELNLKNSGAYHNRGLSKHYLKDYDGAIKDYKEAIKIDPNYAYSYGALGLSKHYLKDYDGAIKDYNEAIRLNPSISETYNNRGAVKYDLANTKEKNSEEYNKLIKEAIEDYNKAIELNPNYSEAYNNRGLAKLQLGKIEEAIKDFVKAYELSNNNNIEVKEKAKNRLINLANNGNEVSIEFCKKYNINYNDNKE